MIDKQYPEIKNETVTMTFNGVTKEYPVKNYETYEELPQKLKDNLIKSCKEEIKSNYEKYGTILGFYFHDKMPYELYIINGTHCSINMLTILCAIIPELKTYCDDLFGPNVPYCFDYDYPYIKISFIHNI